VSLATILGWSKGEDYSRIGVAQTKVTAEDAAFWNRELKESTSCPKKKLVVVNGDGGGKYCAGDEVKIDSDPCSGGGSFYRWRYTKGHATISDTSASSTTLIMAEDNAEVRAVCLCDEYNLAVEEGTGNGDYCEQTGVDIFADECPPGEEFDKWSVISGDPKITDISSSSTTLIVPKGDSRVKAGCKKRNAPYKLIVSKGSGDGYYFGQDVVPVNAKDCADGGEFDMWKVKYGNAYIRDINEPTTIVILRNEDSKIEALCKGRYRLIVERGSGDGEYIEDSSVAIVANDCADGEEFDKWSVISGDPKITDKFSSSTTLITPNEDSRVEATCKKINVLYNLVVERGNGDGEYIEDSSVAIVADDCADGEEFDKWSVISGDPKITDISSSSTTLITPNEDSTVEATCKKTNVLYILVVEKGNGDGEYIEGSSVVIVADDCPDGEEFDKWSVISGDPKITDISSSSTTLITPNEDSRVEATCKKTNELYKLVVERGSGDGDYLGLDVVLVKADGCGEDEEFDRWEIVRGTPYIRNINDPSTVVILRNEDSEIKLVCKDTDRPSYTLIIERGSGDGEYIEDSSVDIVADDCADGEEFDNWSIVSGDPKITDIFSFSTTLITPNKDSIVQATCKKSPTPLPTRPPTPSPTRAPTPSPTRAPTPLPTGALIQPTRTRAPTPLPTGALIQPTRRPLFPPNIRTRRPTRNPAATRRPTRRTGPALPRTGTPSNIPSTVPSNVPTDR